MSGTTSAFAQAEHLKVTQVPQAVRERLGLDPFYQKHVSAGGFPIVSSQKVTDHALLEAGYLVNRMLADRPDIRKALIQSKVRLVVMAYCEMTTDVPEHSQMEPPLFWDRRARGLGATPGNPVVSCGEENLLRYPGDPYHEENILIHEFAHAMHNVGLHSVDPSFQGKIEKVYRAAMEAGRWEGKYAANNPDEFWAEAVQSYFDTNRKPDHDHNHVDTREELFEYEPDLAALVAGEFRNTRWRYVRPSDRSDPAHLTGYDRAAAPKFAWPEDVLQWWKENKEGKPGKK